MAYGVLEMQKYFNTPKEVQKHSVKLCVFNDFLSVSKQFLSVYNLIDYG